MSTVNECLVYITRAFFISLSVHTLIDFVRWRDAVRRDIALLFLSIGLTIAISVVTSILGLQSRVVNMIGALVLMAQPYTLIRLVNYLRPVSPSVNLTAVAAMVLSMAGLLLSESPPPRIAIILIIAYFTVYNTYAMRAFLIGAFTTRGAALYRLRFCAIGSGLFGLALLGAGAGTILPENLAVVSNSLIQVAAILSALGFYIGFVPPQWLMKSWQLVEVQYHLTQRSQQHVFRSKDEVYQLLCSTATQVTGAHQSFVLHQTQNGILWTVSTLDKEGDSPQGTKLADDPVVQRAWDQRIPVYISAKQFTSLTDFDAEMVFIVPIMRVEKAWGILIVLSQSGSLFPDTDLDLLTFIAEQISIVLENAELFEEVNAYATNLEAKVQERTIELHHLNAELEQRVADRTAHLTALNQELAAFSYSVSHDLRAPLRSINGFSQALLEDYNDHLDSTGQDYLNRIRAASERMGQLIDDLINLSLVSRMEMKFDEVDLSKLAQEVTTALAETNPDRKVEIIIPEGIIAHGDRHLLRIVLDNLLGNAWKFSRNKPDACIEFGHANQGDKSAYFVRDNGAGFDMAYANKLFGAFQRLHDTTQFEGTGIGVATCKRIIHRHGGEIWAEAEVDQGATFYFTL